MKAKLLAENMLPYKRRKKSDCPHDSLQGKSESDEKMETVNCEIHAAVSSDDDDSEEEDIQNVQGSAGN